MQNSLIDDLKEIHGIERAVWSCWGACGRCALIKSNPTTFLLTHDASHLLNSLAPPHSNRLYKLLVESANRHSSSHGDNVKLTFIYSTETVRRVFSAHDQADLRVAIRLTPVSWLVDKLREYFEQIDLEEIDNLDANLTRFCVLYDLEKLNRGLHSLTSQILPELIRKYSSRLNSLVNDIEFTFVHSDKSSLSHSRLFSSGFLLDSKLTGYSKKSVLNAVFILKSTETSETTVTVNSLDTLGQIQRVSFFSKAFLDALSKHQVGIVFYEGGLNEFKKQELRNRSCAFVSYLDPQLIEFLCARIRVLPVYEDNLWNKSSIDLGPNCFRVDAIESVDENLNFYQVSQQPNLTFVYFCSPIRAIFSQFKSHVRKVARTLESVSSKSNSRVIPCGEFESHLVVLFKRLELEFVNDRNFSTTCRFLRHLFEFLDIKMNGNRVSRLKSELVEPLELKLAVLSQCITTLNTISKLDTVYIAKNNKVI